MISGPFRGQRLNTLGGHMEVIKKRVNKFGTRSVKQISPKLLTLISPKIITLISPRTEIPYLHMVASQQHEKITYNSFIAGIFQEY